MKDITRIHLAATPFNIDITAKKELEKYLKDIEHSLHADADTLREIESRIIELLAERKVTGERVITPGDVESIEQQLGSPVDFVDGAAAVETAPAAAITQKRMMRDDDRGLIGGVLAGIGAYSGINPNWVRLVAILLTFASFGTVLLVYIVLWLAVPVARTAAEKLQMYGKPVTLAALQESSAAVHTEPRTKPFLVILRIIVGLGFVSGAIVPVVLLALGVGVGSVHLNANQDLLNGWLISVFGLMIVCGVLFTVLMVMAAYSTFAWRFTKPIAYSGLAVIVVGVVLSAITFGFGAYGIQEAHQKIESMKKVYTTDFSTQFEGVKSISFENKDIPVEYRQSEDGAARAELTTIERGDKQPNVSAIRDGDMVRIRASTDESMPTCLFVNTCRYDVTKLVIYGPAMDVINVKDGRTIYYGQSQASLTATVDGDAKLSIVDTAIVNLDVTISASGVLSADDATVENATVNISKGGWTDLGVIKNLNIVVGDTCTTEGDADITVEQVTTLKLNDRFISNQDTFDSRCVDFAITGMNHIEFRRQHKVY